MIGLFKSTSYRWNALSVVLLALLAFVGLTNANNVSGAAESTTTGPPPERSVTFPEDPAWLASSKGGSGTVRWIQSSRLGIRDWNPTYDSTYLTDWNDLGEALGQVTVPAGQELALKVVGNPWGNLAPLADLPPDTFQFVAFWRESDKDVTQWITRDDLRIVARQRSLRALQFLNMPLDDDALVELSALTNLKELILEGTQVTDAGLVHVAAMPWLEYLSLKGTNVTDAGMAYLADMTTLKALSLDRTDVSDSGLAHLRNLTSLESLSMNNTELSDAGLAHLKNLPALRELQAAFTLVTAAGLDQLPNLVPHDTEPFVRSQVKVGMILSHFQATGPSWVGKPYAYDHQKILLKALVDCGFDVYAVIDPGSKELGELPIIIESAGIGDAVIESTDRIALEGLDVVVSGLHYNISPEAAAALNDAVRGGVGFLNLSVLGLVSPGNPTDNKTIHEIIGIENGQYGGQFKKLTSKVLARHPILGPLEVGDPFTFQWLDALRGRVDGTPLLGTPDGVSGDYVPLYVRQLGEGRIINCQWLIATNQIRDFSAEDFLIRCVLWAAKFPLD